jgi:WD40 repeat protein
MKLLTIILISSTLLILSVCVDAQEKYKPYKKLRWEKSTYLDEVRSVKYLGDENRIVSATVGAIILWNTKTGRQVWIKEFDERKNKNDYIISEIRDMQVSVDGKTIAVAVIQNRVVNNRLTDERTENIFILDLKNGQVLKTLKGGIEPIAFSSDGSLASSLANGDTVIWNWQTGEKIQSISNERKAFPKTFSPDGKLLVIATGSPEWNTTSRSDIIIWDVENKKEIKAFEMKSRVANDAAFSQDGKILVISGESPTEINFIDMQTWEVSQKNDQEILIDSLTFSPNGNLLLSLENNVDYGEVYFFNIKTGKKLNSIKFQPGPTALAISPNSQEFAVGTENGKILLYRW